MSKVEWITRRDDSSNENEWPEVARRLDAVLRRLGLLAEDAFYAVAHAYAESVDADLERIAERGGRAYEVLLADREGRDLVASLVVADPEAHSMPVIYQRFVGTKFRRGSGMYFTPRPVAAAMASMIPRRRNAVILDPTCGGGTFLTEVARYFGDYGCQLLANDVDSTLADLTRIRLARLPGSRDFVVREENIYDNQALGDWHGGVDAIIANPPFSLKITAPGFQSPLFDIGYNLSDALFLDLAHDMLRSGGRLVCLLPHSLLANTDYEEFRKLVQTRFVLRAAIGLPEGVFYTTADTTTRAGIVVLDKASPTILGDTIEVVVGHASSVGVSLNSRDHNPADSLAEIVGSAENRHVLGLDS